MTEKYSNLESTPASRYFGVALRVQKFTHKEPNRLIVLRMSPSVGDIISTAWKAYVKHNFGTGNRWSRTSESERLWSILKWRVVAWTLVATFLMCPPTGLLRISHSWKLSESVYFNYGTMDALSRRLPCCSKTAIYTLFSQESWKQPWLCKKLLSLEGYPF